MCLAALALAMHPRYALVIAANRDEYHARPAAAAHWWPQGFCAGRDERAGGTWFGVTRQGRYAFVTNVREPGRNDPAAPSRGELVPRLLTAPGAIADACAGVARDGAHYNGFNIVAGEIGRAYHLSNRRDDVVALRGGVHGIANAALDTPWPKVVRTREVLAHWCARGDDDLDVLWAALADRTVAADESLPSTGIARERERLLSAPFIADPVYGTRSSTLLTITHDGEARFLERTFGADGIAGGENQHCFTIARSTSTQQALG